jgi:hypothetical protein
VLPNQAVAGRPGLGTSLHVSRMVLDSLAGTGSEQKLSEHCDRNHEAFLEITKYQGEIVDTFKEDLSLQ